MLSIKADVLIIIVLFKQSLEIGSILFGALESKRSDELVKTGTTDLR